MSEQVAPRRYYNGPFRGVRMFFSIDITDSAELKRGMQDDQWPFIELFQGAEQAFNIKKTAAFKKIREEHNEPKLYFWRLRGDEILFYSGIVDTYTQIAVLLFAFRQAIDELNMRFDTPDRDLPMAVKGAAWAAEFPKRNVEIVTDPSKDDYFKVITADTRQIVEAIGAHPQPADENAFDYNYYHVDGGGTVLRDGGAVLRDFWGFEVDAGFRLREFSEKGMVVVSLDVARLATMMLAEHTEDITVRFFHVGNAILAGCFNNEYYPIIYMDAEHERALDPTFAPELRDKNNFIFSYKKQSQVTYVELAELDRKMMNGTRREEMRLVAEGAISN